MIPACCSSCCLHTREKTIKQWNPNHNIRCHRSVALNAIQIAQIPPGFQVIRIQPCKKKTQVKNRPNQTQKSNHTPVSSATTSRFSSDEQRCSKWYTVLMPTA